MLSDLRHRLRALFRRGAVEKELDEELQFHLEMQAEKHMRSGLGREEALRRARLDLGGVEATKEEHRDARGVRFVETLVQDLRYGVRVLRKSPGFTAVAVLTLALGIGANTALFSVVSGVLLEPLPYPHAEELVTIHQSKPNFRRGSISYLNFRDWQKDNHSFAAMAIARMQSFSLTGVGEPERLKGELVSAQFFSLLGVEPSIGRNLAAGEDEVGAAPVVLISAGLWKRKLGGDPDVIGRSLLLDGQPFTVVGVIPAHFDLVMRHFQPGDVYVPIGQWKNQMLANRGAGLGIHGIGRLRPGVTVEQAQADLDGVTRELALAYPDANKGTGASLVPITDAMVGNVRPFLLVLLAAVAFVLLIACANVANLLLARASGRTREFAIRVALGAGRGRLLRQLLTEGILLALLGGGLGLLVAAWGTSGVLALLPLDLPRAAAIGIDGRVLAVTTAVALAAGLLFGLTPMFLLRAPDLHDTLRSGGRVGPRGRAQAVLVVVQVATALVLLVGAGLMFRTVAGLWRVDPGFDPRDALSFELALAPAKANASPTEIRAITRELGARLAAVPGVAAVSLSWGAFPMVGDEQQLFWPSGRPRPVNYNELSWALRYIVEPSYLRAMGIPLLRGRFLGAGDDERAPRVTVVDEVFAEKYFHGADPLGQMLSFADRDGPVEIVGVVGHVKQWGLDRDDLQPLRAQLYVPFQQMPDASMKLVPSGMRVVLRSPAPGTLAAVRGALQAWDHELVVYDARTLETLIADSLGDRQVSMILLGVFAGLALLLSSIGIYGVVAYAVCQRTNEIGIRVALGARRAHVLRLVLGQGARMAIAGIAIGVAAALGLTRLMASLLYGVDATDPTTFGTVALGLGAVALLAAYLPARRALRVDPMIALRHE